MANWITEVRGVIGGMIKDLLKRNIPKNKYWEAENIALSPNNQDSLNGASVQLGSEFAFGLNEIDATDPVNGFKYFRVPIDLSASSISHTFTITYGSPSTTYSFTISSALGTPASRYAQLTSLLLSNTAVIGGNIFQAATPAATKVYIGFKVNTDAQISLTIAGIKQEVIILQEYLANSGGAFSELKSINIEENLFVLATNGSVLQLSVGKKDYLTGTWTNKILLQTNTIQIPIGTPIDMDGQIDFGERLSIYFTTNGIPRCTYVPYKNVWNDFASMIWFYDQNTNTMVNNTDGYYLYNSIESETALQLLQNFARVSNAIVATGGALKTGNKQYYIRQISGNEVKTGIGMGSGQISIFQSALTDPQLFGNIAGLDTNKKATLTIENLDPSLYDKFELICTENNGGVFTANIVNVFDITGETMTVTHFGNETQISVSQSEFAQEQVLLKTAKNLVIARNRLFVSNITTQVDYDLSAWAQTIALAPSRDSISLADYVNVGEYQSIPNIFNKTGYMFLEKYRFGIKLYFTNGFVSRPYYINDVSFNIGNTQLTNALGLGTPTATYVWYLLAQVNLNTAPTIDGKTLKDVLYGYEIVRQECIPEVLATGFAMPLSDWDKPAPSGGWWVGGGRVVGNFHGGGPTIPLSNRDSCAFYSPEVIFGTADIEPLSGDQIINYSQPNLYNTRTNTTGNTPNNGIETMQTCNLAEFSGDWADVSSVSITISEGEVIGFDLKGTMAVNLSANPVNTQVYNTFGPSAKSISVIDLLGNVFTTTPHGLSVNDAVVFYDLAGGTGINNNQTYYVTVVYGANSFGFSTTIGGPLVLPSVVYTGGFVYYADITPPYGCNQKVIALNLNTPLNFNVGAYASIDYGFYYSAYYRAQPNKYGSPENGNYISCGYFRKLSVGVGGTYNDSVYGGDTFTQRTYLKFCNYSSSNPSVSRATAVRVGLSFYTQNRANFQLRNFNLGTSKDYPYTTVGMTSGLTEWMGLDMFNAGQSLYDISNSPLQIPTSARQAFNPNEPLDTTEENILYYSDLKVNDSLSDPYRMFMPLNRKSYPAMYGGIQNTFTKDSNSLIVMMDNQVYLQALDQQQNQTNSDGTNIIIGDGSVLGARELPLSQIGAPLKTAAVQYKTSSGRIHVAYFNPYLKKLIRIGEGVTDIGETTGVQSFLTNNTDRCFSENSVIFGYNFINDELYMTAVNTLPSATLWNNASTYNAGDIVWLPSLTNPSQQYVYYKAKINVSANKNPTNLVNQVNYWELIRQSNFTLVYNDKLAMTSGFKGIYPMRYLPFNETYLSAYLTQSPLSGVFLTRFAEHNKGITEYGTNEIVSFVKFYFNDVADYYKIARLLYMDINDSPIFVMVRTENNDGSDFVTYSQEPEINYTRPHWATAIRNDATISVDNPNGLADINTAQMAGQLIEVTVYFKNTNVQVLNVLKNISLRSIIKPKLFNI